MTGDSSILPVRPRHNSFMRFEHLVAVNDPQQVYIVPLSRAQVWAGLMRRVEDARPFLPALESCDIVARGDGWVERCLDFGSATICDRVTYLHDRLVCFDTAPTANHGGGRLQITIEEPASGRIFLRFEYDTVHAVGAEAEDAAYEGYLRQAYEAVDIDTVQVIRLLATDAE